MSVEEREVIIEALAEILLCLLHILKQLFATVSYSFANLVLFS